MPYQIEGKDENGGWSWSNISADGVHVNVLFEEKADAESAADYLATKVYQCPRDEIRVIELEEPPCET
jgi:hypothetical protein